MREIDTYEAEAKRQEARRELALYDVVSMAVFPMNRPRDDKEERQRDSDRDRLIENSMEPHEFAAFLKERRRKRRAADIKEGQRTRDAMKEEQRRGMNAPLGRTVKE